MIKKLFRTKKSLPMPAPVSPYKDLPEFLGQGEPFTTWDRHPKSSAFFVNIPRKNKKEPGTLKIMFDGRDGFYDLENNKFSGLPEGWEKIDYSCGCGGIEGPLKYRYGYGGPWDFSFFPVDKYMQMLCSNCGIKNAEKNFPNFCLNAFGTTFAILKIPPLTHLILFIKTGKDLKENAKKNIKKLQNWQHIMLKNTKKQENPNIVQTFHNTKRHLKNV